MYKIVTTKSHIFCQNASQLVLYLMPISNISIGSSRISSAYIIKRTEIFLRQTISKSLFENSEINKNIVVHLTTSSTVLSVFYERFSAVYNTAICLKILLDRNIVKALIDRFFMTHSILSSYYVFVVVSRSNLFQPTPHQQGNSL